MTDPVDRLREALAERYLIGDEVGRGGMSIVYRAKDLRHERDVAIKILRPELASALGSDRFLREIRIAARLQHPNILPLHDSGDVDGTLYYVMPFVEGESLASRLDKEEQLGLDEGLEIVRDVASALSYAHEQGIVHRDIKPANILLSSGKAIVADFGIARAIDEAGGEEVTTTGLALGTPEYMSPEQASGSGTINGRSDIYSLGCVLFEMLAGEPPFTGRSAQAIIARQIQERLPSLEVVRPATPLHVINAIETALQKIPADRFNTAAEFMAALDAGSTPVPTPPVYPWWRRWQAIAAGIVATAVAAVLIVLSLKPPVVLDPAKVVVFPLEELGLTPEYAGTGYDIALMAGASLEHTEPLRTRDGRLWLDEQQRANIAEVTSDIKRVICLERRAGFYIDGVVRSGGGSGTVVLRLHDVAGDSVFTQESETRGLTAASFVDIGFGAMRKLLPALLDPGREVDISVLSDREPGAIADWIHGEREYRSSHFAEALSFYERAIEKDSSLVIAAVRGSQAASWPGRYDDAGRLIEIAISRDSLLTPIYRHFAHGLHHYLEGRADSAVARFRDALNIDSEWSEAWAAIGEVYHHLFPRLFPLDSLAEHAFTVAVEHDPANSTPLRHLAEYALRRGDVPRAAVLINSLRDVGADTSVLRQLTLLRGCVVEGAANIDWNGAARENPGAVLLSAKRMMVASAQPDCAAKAFKAILALDSSYTWGALLGLHGYLISRGDTLEAQQLLDSAYAAGENSVLWLYVLNPATGMGMDSKGAEVEVLAKGWFGENYERGSTGMQWLFSVWHSYLGDVDKAAEIANSLDSIARSTGIPQDSLYAAAAAAHLALACQDTSEAVARFSSLSPVAGPAALSWGLTEALATERFILARLLMARRRYEEAYRVASLFDHSQPAAFWSYVPASLDLRLRAAEALGRRDWAEQTRSRLEAIGRQPLLH